ncbi:MAG: methyltransferase domain-containing protein [Opitutales bacterium]|nr:methyltransferase domain-containing protein [Opitutales bacterium]
MTAQDLYKALERVNERPKPYEFSTASELWCDPYRAEQMLKAHLDPDNGMASRTGAFIQRSLDWMTRRFDIGRETAITDFGCGPGLYTNALARTGARVTGVDFSSRSISYARSVAEQEGLDVRYEQADYLAYRMEAGSCDLATLIFCDLCPLSPSQRAGLLTKICDGLSEKGLLLLDVCTSAMFEAANEASNFSFRHLNGFWAEGDYYGFQRSFKYEEESLLLDKYTIVEPERVYEIYNWLQCFSQMRLREELAASGLKILEWYSNVAGDSYDPQAHQMAVVAARA